MKTPKITADDIKDYFMMFVGMAIYGVGFCGFILPAQLVSGGLAGLTALIFYATGIPVAVSMYSINLVLLAIALKILGKQFVARTIIGATFIAFWIAVLQPVFTKPIIVGDPFFSVVVGGVICGSGLGLCFAHNGTTGGTDIVAAIIQKYKDLSMGRALMCADLCVICSSWFLFHDLSKIVYGIVFLYILTSMSDVMINTNKQTLQFIIMSRKWDEIAEAINIEMHRGCTLLHGMGSYTRGEMNVLLVYCSAHERQTLVRILYAIDSTCFMTQSNVAVYGNGFNHVKFKKKDIKVSEKIIENIEQVKRTKTLEE
ncbi:MAG: YitT family protein [Muribaculaceae bacterium]|nr:YitT family protein [Muribaculaceae bacterium]